MKNSGKLIIIAVFGVFVLGLVLTKVGAASEWVSAMPNATPTPAAANAKPANTAADTAHGAANASANAAVTKPAGAAGGKTIPKTFTLAKDSVSDQYGEVAFDHDKHAFEKYSPDGTSVMACTECHHTDQPKSMLKLPDVTSERDVKLTMDVFQTTTQAVTECRSCHFQEGDQNVPTGKTMPSITENGKSKEMNNQIAFHLNCNTCHDAAFKARPELKKRPGFATSKDCTICHKPI